MGMEDGAGRWEAPHRANAFKTAWGWGPGKGGIKGDRRLDLEAWKMRMPFLGTGTFMRKTRMELDGKEKGGRSLENLVSDLWLSRFK